MNELNFNSIYYIVERPYFDDKNDLRGNYVYEARIEAIYKDSVDVVSTQDGIRENEVRRENVFHCGISARNYLNELLKRLHKESLKNMNMYNDRCLKLANELKVSE